MSEVIQDAPIPRDRLELPRWRAALKRHASKIPAATYWRYSVGLFPPPLSDVLLSDPDALEELAADLRALAAQQHAA